MIILINDERNIDNKKERNAIWIERNYRRFSTPKITFVLCIYIYILRINEFHNFDYQVLYMNFKSKYLLPFDAYCRMRKLRNNFFLRYIENCIISIIKYSKWILKVNAITFRRLFRKVNNGMRKLRVSMRINFFPRQKRTHPPCRTRCITSTDPIWKMLEHGQCSR